MNNERTPGTWNYACDSYGKVRHSRKACVYTTVTGPNGDRIVTVAARIPNWTDAHLIAAVPDLLAACKAMLSAYAPNADFTKPNDLHSAVLAAGRAIAKAEGAAL